MSRLDQLTKLYESDPSDPFLTYGIGLEHSNAGDFETAIQWLDKTLEIDAGYCYAYFQKAKALSEMGKDDDARATAQEGIRQAGSIDPATGVARDAHAQSELSELLTML